MSDPWDVVWALEDRGKDQDFLSRWRGFVRSVVPLLPGLPADTKRWWEAADAYAVGRLDHDALMAAQTDAHQYLFGLPSATPDPVYCSVRAAMQPLWDHNTGGGWFDGALCFLHDCGAAGVDESAWWPLFQAAFPELCGAQAPNPAPHTPG